MNKMQLPKNHFEMLGNENEVIAFSVDKETGKTLEGENLQAKKRIDELFPEIEVGRFLVFLDKKNEFDFVGRIK